MSERKFVIDEERISLLRTRIKECLDIIDTPELFSTRVNLLRMSLPMEVKYSDEFLAATEECTEDITNTEFLYNCGVPIVSKELGSPYTVTYPETNWVDIFELCLNECEKLGITWKKIMVRSDG